MSAKKILVVDDNLIVVKALQIKLAEAGFVVLSASVPNEAIGAVRRERVRVAVPPGGLYAFFRVEGRDDSLAFAKELVARHGLGLAPGVAFGPEGEGWLRWCFASKDPARLDEGVRRLAAALGSR